jgi:hypothetical protein
MAIETTTTTAVKIKPKFSHQELTADLRDRVKGYLLCMVDPGAAASVGAMAVKLGCLPATLGEVCRALAAAGEIGSTGNARGRKYFAIIS